MEMTSAAASEPPKETGVRGTVDLVTERPIVLPRQDGPRARIEDFLGRRPLLVPAVAARNRRSPPPASGTADRRGPPSEPARLVARRLDGRARPLPARGSDPDADRREQGSVLLGRPDADSEPVAMVTVRKVADQDALLLQFDGDTRGIAPRWPGENEVGL